MSDEHPDRVLVSEDNLARCKWCGTPESPRWTISKSENIYCTHQCMLADESSRNRRSGKFGIGCGLVLSIPFILSAFVFPPFANVGIFLMLYGMLFLVIGIGQYAESREGQKYKDRKDRYRGISPIICPYCSHQNSPHIKACQNCGAPLSKASFSRATIPPWLQKTTLSGAFISGGFKCPYCSVIYSYRYFHVSHDGMVICQNCARPFRPAGSPS
ncbi:MAG: hypothetical protein ACFFCX_06140 [Candidatus Sifarchaeia archaeon]